MRKSGFSRKWRLVLIGAIAFLLLIITAPMGYSQNPGNLPTVNTANLSLLAQTPTPQISPSPSVSNSINIQEATVNIDGKKLFVIKAKLGEVPPKERARTTEEKIIRIAQDSSLGIESNKRPRRKQRGIVTLFLTFHTPQGAGNLPVILLNGLTSRLGKLFKPTMF